jgi:hypothetical protein
MNFGTQDGGRPVEDFNTEPSVNSLRWFVRRLVYLALTLAVVFLLFGLWAKYIM